MLNRGTVKASQIRNHIDNTEANCISTDGNIIIFHLYTERGEYVLFVLLLGCGRENQFVEIKVGCQDKLAWTRKGLEIREN